MPSALTRHLRALTGPTARWLILALLPVLVAFACEAVALQLPEEDIFSQMALSGLLSVRPFLGLLGLPYLALLARRAEARGAALFGLLPCLLLLGRPPALWPQDPQPGATTLLVTNVNAYSDSPDRAALEAHLAQSGADLIVVIEKRALQIEGYARVADNFEAPLSRVSHATAVFCRDGLACPATVTEEFGAPGMVMPLALVRLPGPACLLGVHAPPPAPKDARGLVPYVERIAAHLDQGRISAAWGPCEPGDRVALAGDLNAVPDSPAYNRLIARGLTDAFGGASIWSASWPSGGGWLDAPFFHLDHLLTGPGLAVDGLERRAIPNTDHKATFAALRPI